MKNLTIAHRVAIATGFLCVVIAALSVFTALRFASMRALSDEIVTDAIPGIIFSGQVRDHQAEAELRALRLLLTPSSEQRASIRREIDDLSKEIGQELDRYERTLTTAEDRQLFDTLKARRAEFLRIREDYVQLVERDRDEAIRLSAGRMRDAYSAYGDAGDLVLKHNADTGADLGKTLAREVAADIRSVTIAGATAVVLGIAAAALIVLSLNRALTRVARSLGEGADQVAAAATQVSASSQSLASGASEQAASLEETSSALEQVASMSKRNAESANRAKSLSDQTRAAADRGADKIAQMQQAMDAIKASSDEVSQIVKTIDEIAFQTNILALNAAVEAARAGEAGAGFAVVADEVRNLAQRAAASAQQTSGRIDDSVRRSEHGVSTSRDVASVLTEILESARQVDLLIGEITTASDEQTRGLEQVNQAITQMNSITQANAGSSEESAAAAEELNAQALAQKQAVAELEALVQGRRLAGHPRPESARPTDRRSAAALSRTARPKLAATPRALPALPPTPVPASSCFADEPVA